MAKPPFAAFEENVEQDPLDFLNLMTIGGDTQVMTPCLATLRSEMSRAA